MRARRGKCEEEIAIKRERRPETFHAGHCDYGIKNTGAALRYCMHRVCEVSGRYKKQVWNYTESKGVVSV